MSIAEAYIAKLFSGIDSNNIVEDGANICKEYVKKIYAPYVHGFAQKVKEACDSTGATALCLARDATPFHVVFQQYEIPSTLGYFTRGLLGQNDEIAGNTAKDADMQSLQQYFHQVTEGKNVIIVDAGMYGSMVETLCKVSNQSINGVMYLFSKNPMIYGYVNELWDISTIDTSIDSDVLSLYHTGTLSSNLKKYITANILIDSFECAHPHPIASPKELVKIKDTVQPLLQKRAFGDVQELLEVWWESTLEAYTNGDMTKLPHQELYDLIHDDTFHGLIHTITPEWSGKSSFLQTYAQKVGGLEKWY